MLTVAFLLGLIICLLLGVPYIDFLKKHLFGQSIKDVAPETHAKKQGTPTTGGIFIISSIIIAAIITLMLAQKLTAIGCVILITLVFYTLAGFQDDYLKIKGKTNDGLSAKAKLIRQILIALLPTFYVVLAVNTTFNFGPFSIDLGYFYPILAVFIITGASNAYNLTDGLDGLAASTGIPVFIVFTIILMLCGCPEGAIISSATAGALCGFLKYNKSKAQVFMGDTGSLAIGGLMGTLAVIGKIEFLIIILAGLFILETLSVIFQVSFFKLTGKKLFKMTPFHHHYELMGWSETRIVTFFTCISTLFSLIALYCFILNF
jgi:phospho-N-acetylmuramoyl-pentapeptide-transferase